MNISGIWRVNKEILSFSNLSSKTDNSLEDMFYLHHYEGVEENILLSNKMDEHWIDDAVLTRIFYVANLREFA